MVTGDRNTARWSAGRRDFLRLMVTGVGVGAGVGAMADVHAGAHSGVHAGVQPAPRSSVSSLLDDDAFWRHQQDLFVLDDNRIFMNTGTSGSMPLAVLEQFARDNRQRAVDAAGGYSNLADLRARIAPAFGVDGDELALSGNASSGLCHAILGLVWRPGDVVVTTNHEHNGGNTPLAIAANRYGIEISRIALPVGNAQRAEDYVALFDQRVRLLRRQGKRVRALMWSSPTYKTGTMLPIAQLMEVVKQHELISFVDGAHLPGMMDYDYGALGVDFMAGSGHKWQCGPGSTGLLVMRNKIRPANPLPLPAWYPVHTSVYVPALRSTTARASTDIAASVSSCGSLHLPMFRALTLACEMWDGIGRKHIETYDLALSAYLKERIAERWGVQALYSPKDDARLVSAMTCFNPFMEPALALDASKTEQFVARLRGDHAPGFVVRKTDFAVIGAPAAHHAVRISTHLWNDVAQVDRLVEAMWRLAHDMNDRHDKR